jgi:NAD(P)-dependent dehydrogenase (short-subunit alcohol dehydrogenase family)
MPKPVNNTGARFNPKVAVVTGAGGGIGEGVARRFSEKGMAVVIAEKNAALGRRAEKELAQNGTVKFVQTDVSKESSVKHLIQTVVREYRRLDILINNAGAFNFKPMNELSFADWNEVIATNLSGNFLCSKYAAPHLKKTKGSIVNISSTRALMSEPDKEAYAASKGGIVALTHALALSLGPDVRVNCISPDWIDVGKEPVRPKDHEQFPAGRVGTVDDVAQAVMFLCDPRNSFITGINLILDGGKTRQMSYL